MRPVLLNLGPKFGTSKFIQQSIARDDEQRIAQQAKQQIAQQQAESIVNQTIVRLKKITTTDMFLQPHSGDEFLEFFSEVGSQLPSEERQSGILFHELFEPIYKMGYNTNKKLCDAFWMPKQLEEAKAFLASLCDIGVMENRKKNVLEYEQKYIDPRFLLNNAKQDLELTELGRLVVKSLKK